MPENKPQKEIRITKIDPILYDTIRELARKNKRTLGKEAEYQLSVALVK